MSSDPSLSKEKYCGLFSFAESLKKPVDTVSPSPEVLKAKDTVPLPAMPPWEGKFELGQKLGRATKTQTMTVPGNMSLPGSGRFSALLTKEWKSVKIPTQADNGNAAGANNTTRPNEATQSSNRTGPSDRSGSSSGATTSIPGHNYSGMKATGTSRMSNGNWRNGTGVSPGPFIAHTYTDGSTSDDARMHNGDSEGGKNDFLQSK